MSKQDRVAPRTAADIERKYNFGQTFAEFAGLVDTAQKAADDAKSAVNDLDKALDQDEIFNRLTNNGEVQGIYRADDGQVYINASYLVTGILRSKNGDTFYLDLDNGVLKGKFEELSISGKTVDTIAQEKANTAVSGQTQTDIFNKLTNNGALQGLYMKDNDIFINASYIKSGKIVVEGETYLRPTYENSIEILHSVVWPDDDHVPQPFYDVDGNGVIDKDDAVLALKAAKGEVDISTLVLLQKSPVTITIDPANPEETIKMVGVNMWGSEIVSVFGINQTRLPPVYGDLLVGRDLFISGSANFNTLSLGEFGQNEESKTLSWKDNGDGTYTLIGS